MVGFIHPQASVTWQMRQFIPSDDLACQCSLITGFTLCSFLNSYLGEGGKDIFYAMILYTLECYLPCYA